MNLVLYLNKFYQITFMRMILFFSILFFLNFTVLSAQAIAERIPKESSSAEVVIIDNYQDIKSFDDLVKPYKGKVVYVDIWATWCGPCRREFAYKDELKEFAKGKDIVFLYISVDKVPKEKQWRKYINKFEVGGLHVQAHPELKDDLIRKFYAGVKKGRKYLILPAFVIVGKNGRVANADARRPSAGKKLHKQLDRQLRK